MMYEQTKYAAIRLQGSDLSASAFFFIAGWSKLVTTLSTYPLQVIQNRLRNFKSKANGEGNSSSLMKDTMACVNEILGEGGAPAMYKGITSKLMQTVLTVGAEACIPPPHDSHRCQMVAAARIPEMDATWPRMTPPHTHTHTHTRAPPIHPLHRPLVPADPMRNLFWVGIVILHPCGRPRSCSYTTRSWCSLQRSSQRKMSAVVKGRS